MHSIKIHSFLVENLNGTHSVKLSFVNNRLILIGENGTGKSTVLTMLYLLLTAQWIRLNEYEFTTITVTFHDAEFNFSYQELQRHVESTRLARGRSRIDFEIFQFIKNAGISPQQILGSPTKIREIHLALRKNNSIPISERRFRDGLLELTQQINIDGDLFTERIINLSRYISALNIQVIFLPTYRRIERDLKTLFPDLTDAIRERTNHLTGSSAKNLIELVEFGMEDVQHLIDVNLNSLRGTFQADVNSMFGEYLRDVLKGSYAYITPDDVKAIDAASLDAILNRLDEQTLPEIDRSNLRQKVNGFSTGSFTDIADRVVAHFLVKLHSLQKTQIAREEKFRNFVDLCNTYLVGKQIEFDSVSFTVKIVLPARSSSNLKQVIELSDLSSGEKQVISLFAHLSLGLESQQFLLIDEPELSLSVPWQRRFLEDISKTARCSGFLAVTHSPFIYDNSLEIYAHGINEFIESL